MLELLDINETNTELYTTQYVDVSRYKCLRFMCLSSHEAYITLCYSIDSKGDSIAQSYHLAPNKWISFKSEIISDYLRVKVVVVHESELIDSIITKVRGRVQVASGLNRLLERFGGGSDSGRLELKDDEKKEERKSSIYTRLGLRKETPKQEAIKQEPHQCKDPRLPDLILKGNLIYAQYNNAKLSTIVPPPEDGKLYVLAMRNKVAYWINPHESGAGWF